MIVVGLNCVFQKEPSKYLDVILCAHTKHRLTVIKRMAVVLTALTNLLRAEILLHARS